MGDPVFENIENDYVNNKYTLDETGSEPQSEFKYKWALMVTILGVILLDFSADTCQSPSRAYLLDICIPDDQTKGKKTFTNCIVLKVLWWFNY